MALETIYATESGQPEGLSLTSLFSFSEKAFFRLTDQDEIPDFWELIIVNVSERFREGEARIPTLADSFIAFSTGAQPIEINISGWLYCATEQDNRIDFLSLYKHYFNGAAATENHKSLGAMELFFYCLHTSFNLHLTQCQILDSSTRPEYTQVNLRGVAYNYKSLYVLNTEDASDFSAGEVEVVA